MRKRYRSADEAARARRDERKKLKSFDDAFAGGYRERLAAMYGPIKIVLEFEGERIEFKPIEDEK
jgi:hypothetical protein